MLKNKLKSLTCFVLMIIIVLSFNACSSQKSNSEYVVAKDVSSFSKLNDTICITNGRELFLENNNGLKDIYDLKLDEDPHYDKPLLVDNYLYYVGGVYDYSMHKLYIARIDYTQDEPKIEKLTPEFGEILSYTVCGNYLYYRPYYEKEGYKLCRMNLLTKKENIIMDDSFGGVFCTNGNKIVTRNMIFDIKSQEKQLFSIDEGLFTLGVLNNKYYCYYDNDDEDYHKVLQINLDDNSIKELCEIPYGMDRPQMCDDKILFTDLPDDCVNVGYYYYDIPTDTIVTIIEPDNSTSRYTETYPDPIRYSYFIHNNMFYFDYFDVIVRMNIDTKEEEFLQLVQKPNGDGSYRNEYDWISYNEYCAIHDENPE